MVQARTVPARVQSAVVSLLIDRRAQAVAATALVAVLASVGLSAPGR